MPDLGFTDMQETFTIVHPVAKDEFGDPVAGTETTQTITGAIYAPGVTTEDDTFATQVQADGIVYIDPDQNVTVGPLDQIVLRGERYEVVGRPRVWLGRVIEVPVRVVTG